jgi:hypothetical protein
MVSAFTPAHLWQDDPRKCHFCITLNINKLCLGYGKDCSEMILSMSQNEKMMKGAGY